MKYNNYIKHKSRLRSGAETGIVATYVVIDGIEHDVDAEYRIAPAEPQVNFDGGIEVECAWYEDQGCILDQLDDDEYEQLVIRVTDIVNGYGDPDDERGDWLHDLAKDIQAEELAMRDRQRGER